VDCLGCWILHLAPFKFRVRHTRAVDNVVADALSRMFDGDRGETLEGRCASLIQSMPLVYSFLEEHQKADPWCREILDRTLANLSHGGSFQVHRNLLCCCPKGAKRHRWVFQASLRPMLLHYFHATALSGHLGARKTLGKIMANFWCPQMRAEIFNYVRCCELCQRAKPAQDTCVGFHSSTPSSQPTERLFMDFVGQLTRTKRGSIAILVILDEFPKFVFFRVVRKISAQVVCDCLERAFFPAYGTSGSIVTDNACVFCCRVFKDLCFQWDVTHVTTTPYYPQPSLDEQVTRNLKEAVKIFHHQSQTAWDEDLPWLSVAISTAVHESTKSTPDKLFLGRDLKCPLLVLWDLSPVSNHDSGETSQSFWTQAYANRMQAKDKVTRRYNTGRRPHLYRVGDTVLYCMNIASTKLVVSLPNFC